MPEMSGRDLSKTLTASRRAMRTLYMSGYTDDALGRHGMLDEEISLIEKPFTPEALARKLREVIEGEENDGGGA
jgi:FixJ family two-component response regulator